MAGPGEAPLSHNARQGLPRPLWGSVGGGPGTKNQVSAEKVTSERGKETGTSVEINVGQGAAG